jgi:hypothetical protein
MTDQTHEPLFVLKIDFDVSGRNPYVADPLSFQQGRNKKVSLPAIVAWLQRVSDAGDADGSKLNNIGDSERITPTTNKREMQCALFM